MAEHDIEVTGIDYAEPMLILARSKAEGRPVEVNWIRDDIRRSSTEIYVSPMYSYMGNY